MHDKELINSSSMSRKGCKTQTQKQKKNFGGEWKIAKEGKEREEETVYMKMAKILSSRVLEGTSVGILLSGTD